MLDGIQLEPHTVLGIAPDASVDSIREAFRRKSLKHHPDRGGDEWAFRIVVRAYQMLSGLGPASVPTLPTRPRPDEMRSDLGAGDTARVAPSPEARWSPVRPGCLDRGIERSRLVQVEIVWVQSEVDDVVAILSGQTPERQLSGSITMTWPDSSLPGDPRGIPFADRILRALNAAFDELRQRPGTTSARSHIEAGRFEAWLQYPSGPVAHSAFQHFHTGLKARGLGVHQWSRILMLPRRASI